MASWSPSQSDPFTYDIVNSPVGEIVKVNDTHGIVHVPSPIILSHVLFSDISVRRLRTTEEVTLPQEQR